MVINIGGWWWLGYLCRMKKLNPNRNVTLLKPEGNRRVGKPQLRLLESVYEGLKETDVRN